MGPPPGSQGIRDQGQQMHKDFDACLFAPNRIDRRRPHVTTSKEQL
jgi:hypothetical protein